MSGPRQGSRWHSKMGEPYYPPGEPCRECGLVMACAEHGSAAIEGAEHMDGGSFYWCGPCVEKYGSAFGAIVHTCETMLSFGHTQAVRP